MVENILFRSSCLNDPVYIHVLIQNFQRNPSNDSSPFPRLPDQPLSLFLQLFLVCSLLTCRIPHMTEFPSPSKGCVQSRFLNSAVEYILLCSDQHSTVLSLETHFDTKRVRVKWSSIFHSYINVGADPSRKIIGVIFMLSGAE